jgi:hypothetical protein
MKFTLKDYQEDAVRDVLKNLAKARKRWHEDQDKHAFSLTAATGAGKTVMAAAVFEALFHGDDNYDFDADPTAVVIWFSDDPSLNEQTRFRLMESSDRLQRTDLVVVENTFNRATFERGKIYFLNTQKLGKKSLLVRGFEGDENGQLFETRPDLHSNTIWDTIRNTIEDPALTLYLVLDEAHRGMGNPSTTAQNERSTLVKRLINGEKGVPGMPVVLGISATVERFDKAMEGAKERAILPPVVVDSSRVRDSGLLKDTIALDIPDETGQFDTVLVRRAAEKLKESTAAWAAYAKEQDSETVVPLMVLQVPNSPNPSDIGRWLHTIFEQWPELPHDCVVNVFGEHAKEEFGPYSVPYLSPEQIQDHAWVRIVIAKDAISTGWDCPRAEVMVSLRHAIDRTHITQLLGRMVRTPLARRIPGNERLNSVDCLLPYFDEKTVRAVADALLTGAADMPPVGRVLINPKELKPNALATEAIWQKFESLPSQTRPQRDAKPSVRLTALAHELAFDGILVGAGKKAHAEMHKVLDAFLVERRDEFEKKREAVLTVEGRTFTADLRKAEVRNESFTAEADDVVTNDAYRRAARILSPDIARTYTEHRAAGKDDAEEDFEGALIEAREDIAATGLLENLQVLFNTQAENISNGWLAKYRDSIRKLPDDRQETYRQIAGLSARPQDISLVRPKEWMTATAAREKDGSEVKLPTYEHHALCDEQGLFPAELDEWEIAVLKAEMQRKGFKCWYRNPDRPSQDSLGVAYQEEGQYKIVRPDFLFFAEDDGGNIAVDIIDPHGTHLSDALPKLKGLALYAETHGSKFRRIESVAKSGGRMRVLNLQRAAVRAAIAASTSAANLFAGENAGDYP